MPGSLTTSESPYAAFVRRNGLNSESMLGWSGRGCHVEFKRRDHIPLATHEVLGSGGYAVVQKVICKSNDERPLAQKIIRDYRTGLEDLMGEVKHIQQLRHRHLIQLVGTYALGWSLHILLFPVGQWNLRAFLEEFQDSVVIEKAYSEFCSLGTFLKCLSSAVAYLHTEVTPHIKHLDIKPENIIVRQYARHRLTVFLTDFGVSRSFKPSATSQDIHTLYTSPIYMAPEVVKHEPFGRPADIFSLGCVFSEMASVLGGRSLLEYTNRRRTNYNGITTISFEGNLWACKSWLQELQSNAPFRGLSIGGSDWWTRLLTLIEKMLSTAAGDRPSISEVLARFPPGPCRTIFWEEYYPTSTPSTGDTNIPQVSCSPNVVADNASDLAVQSNAQESAAVSKVYSLAPKNEPSISLIVDESRRANTATAIDWSGKGAHVEYLGQENAPLEEIEVIGLGSFSLVTKVRTTRRGPYILVKKSLEKANHLLRLEMLLQEVKVLQNLEHPHIVRLVGTLSEKRFFSLLMYPAADCNLHKFMQTITSEREGTKTMDLNTRKNSLYKFMKCLIHGLEYLHSERIRHKDIKPSNILVQQRRNLKEYQVYLTDFGLSTRHAEDDFNTKTAGPTGHTPRYASPETLGGLDRGRAADVFSMGCVWLEMYTVLLGESLERLANLLDPDQQDLTPFDEYASEFNEDAVIKESTGFGYAGNLRNVHKWVERLINYCNMHSSLVQRDTEDFPELNVSCSAIISGLNDVNQMLQEEPINRPSVSVLCSRLGANRCCKRRIEPIEITQGFMAVESLTRKRPPPPPSAIIPFRRDRDFIERDVLADVWQRAFEPGARIGLVGLGGVGKTQVAIEHAYRVREAYPENWVFWVHASSAARFEESYKSIAERVQLTGWNEHIADILGMVYRWLSDENNGRWTMVVDNADSPEVIFEPWDGQIIEQGQQRSTLSSMEHSLSDYLPSSPNGSIIITSRSRKVAEGLIGHEEDILEVRPMDEEMAITLLREKLDRHDGGIPQNDSVDLVQQLDYMPLAITQAAAYINQHAPRLTLSKYLETLKKSDDDRAQLLRMDIRDPRRDGQASSSIIATWHISFEHIRQTRGSAARLLSLMSLFNCEAIPDYLLHEQYIEDQIGDIDFEEDIAMLRAYYLIRVGLSGNLFDIHRLVQLSTRKWLERHGELERWQTRYVNILEKTFPSGDYADWRTCQALFPHVEAMIEYRVDSVDYLRGWASVLYRASRYAWASGRYVVAGRMAKASLEVCEEIYGLDYDQTLHAMSNLALILQYQGKYDEAELMNRRALAEDEKVLGVDHPVTLTSVNNLASVLRQQGKYDEAESMNQRALAGYEKVMGVDHPSTLMSVNNLALVLRHQGRYDEAELMNRRALVGYEKALGVDHPDTLTSVNTLALLLQYQGKFDEAESMNRRALLGREKVLGMDHPDTLTSVNTLALLLQYQGKFDEAESMNRRALLGREKVLGVDHPDTLTSVSCLADLFSAKQDFQQALDLYQRAVLGYDRVLGPRHPTTAACKVHLSSLLRKIGQCHCGTGLQE